MRYPVTIVEVNTFVRAARKVERMMSKEGGSPINPDFALARIREIIASSETLHETDELTIKIPALPRPTLKELQTKWPWIKRIERDTSPEGPAILKLAKAVASHENAINGPEYEVRIAPHHNILLGYQQREWVIANQEKYPGLWALAGKVYIDFPGLVVVYKNGTRRVPFMGQRNERWSGGWNWLEGNVYDRDRVAVSSK